MYICFTIDKYYYVFLKCVNKDIIINGYKSHVKKRKDILRHEQTIAMIIELNHGILDLIMMKSKTFHIISQLYILILSILFYFNKCTATDQIDCVYVWIKMFYNNNSHLAFFPLVFFFFSTYMLDRPSPENPGSAPEAVVHAGVHDLCQSIQ